MNDAALLIRELERELARLTLAPGPSVLSGASEGFARDSFLPIASSPRYRPPMPDADDKLSPADPRDLADAVAFALGSAGALRASGMHRPTAPYALAVAVLRERQPAIPRPPDPSSIIAQVEGSGIALLV
jgi:hypothetical protein